MSRSGVFWKTVNMRFSSLLKMVWNNSFSWFLGLSSISIMVTLLFFEMRIEMNVYIV